MRVPVVVARVSQSPPGGRAEALALSRERGTAGFPSVPATSPTVTDARLPILLRSGRGDEWPASVTSKVRPVRWLSHSALRERADPPTFRLRKDRVADVH